MQQRKNQDHTLYCRQWLNEHNIFLNFDSTCCFNDWGAESTFCFKQDINYLVFHLKDHKIQDGGCNCKNIILTYALDLYTIFTTSSCCTFFKMCWKGEFCCSYWQIVEGELYDHRLGRVLDEIIKSVSYSQNEYGYISAVIKWFTCFFVSIN